MATDKYSILCGISNPEKYDILDLVNHPDKCPFFWDKDEVDLFGAYSREDLLKILRIMEDL